MKVLLAIFLCYQEYMEFVADQSVNQKKVFAKHGSKNVG